MGVSLRTRKPVNQLTLDDFAAFPIWEYADDAEGVEGSGRDVGAGPVGTSVVPKRAYTHVAAGIHRSLRQAVCGIHHHLYVR